MNSKHFVTGITSTGSLTIGNYIGSIKQILNFQDKYKSFVFIANLHAITVPFQPLALKQHSLATVALYLACGLDKNTHIFMQSDVSAHSELCYILTCLSTVGELNKMTQFKDKAAKIRLANHTEIIPSGIFLYPVLMAADILIYNADFVPVGADQIQHLELARDLIKRLNKKCKTTFNVPQCVLPTTGAKIRSLTDPLKKMSKTSENLKSFLSLLDDQTTITKKINGAITDAVNLIDKDVLKRPGIKNLLIMYACLLDLSLDEVVAMFENCNYSVFKKALIKEVWELLVKIQEKYYVYLNKPTKIKQLLYKNAVIANSVANSNLKTIKDCLGLNIFK